MPPHPRAGQPAEPADLIDVAQLVDRYYDSHPDPAVSEQQVAFGTSGHRGSSLRLSFNDDHVAAVTQAVCDYRVAAGINGPLYLGRDTHALSEPAATTALEVLAANGVDVLVDAQGSYTPTPAISKAILSHNLGRSSNLADGIVVTPSHNPPDDGGFKYNPPSGGPAENVVTQAIEKRANQILAAKLDDVRRVSIHQAKSTAQPFDFLGSYVDALPEVIDVDAIRSADIRIGADALGGASGAYWERIAEKFNLNIVVVNSQVDSTFSFMTLDWDGKIRMDCSSPAAMASLIERRTDFTIATGNDADADRHGIVTPDCGLLNPNHYLAVVIDYLYRRRHGWPGHALVGKTMVSSSIIDRVAGDLGRPLFEVPVGFKWFVSGLLDGSIGFGGEESAGATFLRRDGKVWTTDKDGITLALLAAEIVATTGSTLDQYYRELTARLGESSYARIDAQATRTQKAILSRLQPGDISADQIAGDRVIQRLVSAPGNNAPLGGVKVVTDYGWFAARPSGTEDVYKLYAESFRGPDHLAQIQADAQQLLHDVFKQ